MGKHLNPEKRISNKTQLMINNNFYMNILITGGAGFIGSAVVRYLLEQMNCSVVNVDKLTYAGNLDSVKTISDNVKYRFEHIDICDYNKLEQVFDNYQPDAVIHLAAETHVDRSIKGPKTFIMTNIVGTYNLLEVSRKYWQRLSGDKAQLFRFLHVSTDEVYGDLGGSADLFCEMTPYAPSSPYSASKASSDHLVRAWHRTYKLPVLVTNCSNNYGPYQFPEKLIPQTILHAIQGKPIPIYGDGRQIRDWLYVDDHANALYQVLNRGSVGQSYNIGSYNEKKNIDVAHTVCDLLEEFSLNPFKSKTHYRDLITFVADRPGHDVRYAIDASKIKTTLGWVPQETFETGLRKTIQWYLNNEVWWQRVQSGAYRSVPGGGRNEI